MATKSKMSTSVTRKVTKNTTSPPTTEQEFRMARYNKAMADYKAAEEANKKYSQDLADYQAQMKEYKKTPTAQGMNRQYLRPSRDMSQAEIEAYNRRNAAESKKNKQVYVPITKGSKIEKGLSINPKTGDFTGKFGSDPFTGRQYDWSETGSLYGPYTNVVHQKPTGPKKAMPMPKQPVKDFADGPAISMPTKKLPGLKKDDKIVAQPKLTTEVPVAIEKPTKKPVPKRARGGVVVSTVQKHRSLLGKKLFKTDRNR